MSAPDYTTMMKQAGINVNDLTFAQKNRIIAAMSAAYNKGYVTGYGAGVSSN